MDNDERIAVVETKVDTLEKKQDEILALQKTMSDQLSRYKGFFGGIVFVGSALWFVLVFLKDLLLYKLGAK